MTQIQRSRKGRLVAIDDDVSGIAVRLREIDPSLWLAVSDVTGHFVVKQHVELPGGGFREHLVTTAQELDHRLLKRVELVMSDGYDLVADMDRLDDQADRDRDHRFAEQVGPLAEKLAHAIRKDLGHQGRAFIGSAPGG